MASKRDAVLRRSVLILDGAVVLLSTALAWLAHENLRPHFTFFKEGPRFPEYAMVAYLVVPLWLALVTTLRLHRVFERAWTRFELLVELLKLHALGFLAISALLFITQAIINRAIVGTFLLCSFALMYLERAVLARWARYQHEQGQSQERLLLVGEPSPELAAFVAASQQTDFPPRVVGLLCDGQPAPELPPRRGAVAELPRALHDEAVDQVLFFPPMNHPDRAIEALRACEAAGVTAAFAVDLVYRYPVAPDVVSLYQRPFLTFELVPKRTGALSVKHGLDFAVALVGVLAISPLLLLIAFAILVSMGRPVLFAQERVGLHGRRFRMLKFRTMVREAEAQRAELAERNEMSGPVFKIADDPRVTRLGRLLRRWSLDELPQLFNVLSGAMSLVGPRPLPSSEQQDIEGWYRRRLTMKPGITGLWQVSGRSNVDFDEWMKLDLAYVEQWSLRLDLLILLRTLPAVLSRRGAH